VLDRLIERARSNEMILLKGNHETFVPEFLRNPALGVRWEACKL
jgi:hypothetical protein